MDATSSTCGARVDNLTMALGHRVRTNINPLLTRFYSKHTTNKGKTQPTSVSKGNFQISKDENISSNASFRDMMLFRQDQAKKSILVKINRVSDLLDIQRIFPRTETIVRVLPYAASGDKIFVLVEFKRPISVKLIENTAYHVPMKDIAYTCSPMVLYRNTQSILIDRKQEDSLRSKIYSYSNFKHYSPIYIWSQLQFSYNVTDQMLKLCEILSFTDMDLRLRFYTASQISYYVSKLFKNITVVPFGSSVTGFGQLGSDLDLLCTVEHTKNDRKTILSLGQHYSLEDRNIQIQFLELMSVIMKTCMPGITSIKKIFEARVPIIKFFNSFTNMQCDISCSNGVALSMAEILYIFKTFDWRVKPFVCTIRKWAQIQTVTKEIPGTWITNFSLTLMIIFYLQTRKVLPSLREIENLTRIQEFRNYKTNFNVTNTENLHSLLYGFFEYYSIFDFDTKGICVRDAVVKPKLDKSPLYIYNPLQISLNVSKNVHYLELRRIIEKFHAALQILIESDEKYIVQKLLNVIPSEFMPQKRIAMTSELGTNNIANDILNNEDYNTDEEKNRNLIDEHVLANSAIDSNTKSIIK